MSLKPIFQYRDWSAEKPDLDNPPTHRYEKRDRWHSMICPEPTCLREWLDPTGRGPVVLEGADGEPTGLAQPCEKHAQTFRYASGWYERFSDAVEERFAERFGERKPSACNDCGAEYQVFLWGWYCGKCPECTYEKMIKSQTGLA